MARMNQRGRRIFWSRGVRGASARKEDTVEPGTVMPIHRHKGSSETCICIRGHFEEYLYDEQGNLTDTIDMVPAGISSRKSQKS